MSMETVRYINIALEIFGGLLSLTFILCIALGSRMRGELGRKYILMLACNTLVLFSDAAAWAFKGVLHPLNRAIVHAANFCAFSFAYILLALFTDYFVCLLSNNGARAPKSASRLMWALTAVAIALVILSQFNHMYYRIDENNLYRREKWFWLSQSFGILCMFINAALLVRYRSRLTRAQRIALAACILLPVAAMAIQVLSYGVALLYLATTIDALCTYVIVQVEQAQELAEKELELERSRTAIMLNQIRPHFLYNTLEAIGELCLTDPDRAEKAITDFSVFLRGNVDSLSAEGLIPFERELSHTRHYLELEQLRFGRRLTIVLDTPATQFCVPPLTLQPLVENAVRHGVARRREGGVVTIRTGETADAYTIAVIDNGGGFDPDKVPADGRSHVGIQNVRARLRAQCGGTLSISSGAGSGTAVLLSVPKGERTALPLGELAFPGK